MIRTETRAVRTNFEAQAVVKEMRTHKLTSPITIHILIACENEFELSLLPKHIGVQNKRT